MALRILIAILILALPLELPGCGPFLPGAMFFDPSQPDLPEFTRGQLGVLQPTYFRLYLVIAYRHLSGIGLSEAESAAIPPASGYSSDVSGDIHAWVAARSAVKDAKPLATEIDPYRQVKREGYFDTYLNCNGDAFRTAAATLERIQRTDAAADWLAAQDSVFSNCAKGPTIPDSTSDPALRPDRDYQIASAKFYSEQYDAARQDFQSIAADADSPWRNIAPYLAARCLIRQGKFVEAETALQQVAADSTRGRWQVPARRLLGYVSARAHPAERMHELALALLRRDSQATIGQDIVDYRALFDQNVTPLPDDDLTDWIGAFQTGGAGALEKWHALRTLPWLVAAMQAAKPRDTAVPELLAAASDVKPGSPAYLTVNYHRVRLMPPDDARALADELLADKLPDSTRNQFRAERMRLARNFDEFLRYAPRKSLLDPSDGRKPADMLDNDSAIVLDRATPLALLKQAAASALLPQSTRRQLKYVVSLRTLLLARAPSFDAVFDLLKTPGASPFIRGGFGRYTEDRRQRDILHDNWWGCGVFIVHPRGTVPAAPFLSAGDRAQAAAEWQQLSAIPAAPHWMAAQIIAFAQAHPQDPRVPEALHLVVVASRYGCGDGETGSFSQRAFDLLHRRYPGSEWARKTPYWFR